MNIPKSPAKSVKEGYEWLFGETTPPGKQEEFDRQEKIKRDEAARRRIRGFEWFFK